MTGINLVRYLVVHHTSTMEVVASSSAYSPAEIIYRITVSSNSNLVEDSGIEPLTY